MQNRILALAAFALIAVSAAQAQVTSTTTSATRGELAAERRLQLESRLEAAAAVRAARTPEQREQARGRRAAMGNTLSEAQVQFRSELGTYRSGLREKARDLRQQVQAGTMTASEMAVELKAYREANRPENPAGAADRPEPKRTPDAESKPETKREPNASSSRHGGEASGRTERPARSAKPTRPTEQGNR